MTEERKTSPPTGSSAEPPSRSLASATAPSPSPPRPLAPLLAALAVVVLGLLIGGSVVIPPVEERLVAVGVSRPELWKPLRAMGVWHTWTNTFRVEWDNHHAGGSDCADGRAAGAPGGATKWRRPPQERCGVIPELGQLMVVHSTWREDGGWLPAALVALAPPSPERLEFADEAAGRLCWRVELLPAWALSTDRCVALMDAFSAPPGPRSGRAFYGRGGATAGSTEVVNSIRFTGLLGPFVHAAMAGHVAANFRAFNRHLVAAAGGGG